MHNLGTVFRFELIRTLKKKSFWIVALAFPILIGVIGSVIFFSNKATDKAANLAKDQTFSIAITDKSKLVKPEILSQAKAQVQSDKQTGIDAVSSGKIDAYFYYPAAIDQQPIEVYAKDVGIFKNSRYEKMAKALLQQSVSADVSQKISAVLRDQVKTTSSTYKDGQPAAGIEQIVAPGAFLVLFYILIVTFGSRMLNSTTEEKENRVIEMLLTTVQSRALISGKILSLIVLGFIQVLIVLVPVAIIYALLHNQLALPSFDLTSLPLDPSRIVIGFVLFVLSFLLFTGLLVSVSAMAPTAKDAGSFFGVIMLLVFGPLYAAPLFVSTPDALIVKVLSFFPLTAPIPLMLRNAVGNLSPLEIVLGIIILAIGATLILLFAVRAFRYGALEYSRRLNPKELLSINSRR